MEAIHRFDNAKRRRPEGHRRQAMLTPDYILGPVRRLFGGTIGLDPCTEPDNPTKAARFYAPPQDGCDLPWDADTIFCNPPYGEARVRWVDRCIAEASPDRQIVLLLPAHTDTRAFQRGLAACTTAVFVRGRLKFGVLRPNRRQEAASHGSALLGFSSDLAPLAELGVLVRPAASEGAGGER